MNRKLLLLLLFLLLSLPLALVLITRPVIFFNRATSSSSSSFANSYLFASPVQAKADGKQLIRVTVFVLDSQGLGISHQTVSLVSLPRLNINAIQPSTDEYGKAIFDLNSEIPGKFQISASIDNDTLPQPLTIVFY
ncbi:Ig-like domain-containing protein [Patescibacteria group bacterium]|nr:Ig-like domain-containing protein [Patescibacteria group bacterium]